MVIKKSADPNALRTYSSQQLLDAINGEVSLLKSLGANELLEEMMSTGSFCLGLIDLVSGSIIRHLGKYSGSDIYALRLIRIESFCFLSIFLGTKLLQRIFQSSRE